MNILNRKCNLLIIALVLTICLFVSGCKKDDPLLFFNTQPISPKTMNYPSRSFEVGHPVYFIVIVPKGFKRDYIRVQLVKKEEKTEHWGYSIYQSRDYHIDTTKNYFTDYMVVPEKGYYFMQIFSFDNFDIPIIRNDFWVN